jgi:phosphoglycerate dehydrogenase-like enzyme
MQSVFAGALTSEPLRTVVLDYLPPPGLDLEGGAPAARFAFLDSRRSPFIEEQLASADVIVCSELSGAMARLARRARLIQVMGAGIDAIDLESLPGGCTVCNLHVHGTSIAEWVLMAMLSLSRRLGHYDAMLRRGEWPGAFDWENTHARDLRGSVVGVVGLGHIGQSVVSLCRAVGMRAIAVTRRPGEHAAESSSLEWLGSLDDLPRLLQQADFTVLCVALDRSTTGLIDAGELVQIGSDSFLINVSRGPVVNEKALYRALRERTIAGAALDVWYRYPPGNTGQCHPSTQPFWDLENIILSPHIAGRTIDTLLGRWNTVLDQIHRLSSGAALENVQFEKSSNGGSAQ